ncbi:MAG: hypothetical protein HKM04_06430 [Legionellales bacterium]|nr:hypothetical protein [Legionellales bacterium]
MINIPIALQDAEFIIPLEREICIMYLNTRCHASAGWHPGLKAGCQPALA